MRWNGSELRKDVIIAAIKKTDADTRNTWMLHPDVRCKRLYRVIAQKTQFILTATGFLNFYVSPCLFGFRTAARKKYSLMTKRHLPLSRKYLGDNRETFRPSDKSHGAEDCKRVFIVGVSISVFIYLTIILVTL